MQKIILDCDPGRDDAIAILLALSSPKELNVGIKCVLGMSIEPTAKNALRVLSLLEIKLCQYLEVALSLL